MGKLYVITREDLPVGDQAVQAGHSLAAWMLDNPGHKWKNHTLVYLVTQNEQTLDMITRKLVSRVIRVSRFHEPDRNHELTAIACYEESGNIFSRLKLMGHL